jgi:hypothetical protein
MQCTLIVRLIQSRSESSVNSHGDTNDKLGEIAAEVGMR